MSDVLSLPSRLRRHAQELGANERKTIGLLREAAIVVDDMTSRPKQDMDHETAVRAWDVKVWDAGGWWAVQVKLAVDRDSNVLITCATRFYKQAEAEDYVDNLRKALRLLANPPKQEDSVADEKPPAVFSNHCCHVGVDEAKGKDFTGFAVRGWDGRRWTVETKEVGLLSKSAVYRNQLTMVRSDDVSLLQVWLDPEFIMLDIAQHQAEDVRKAIEEQIDREVDVRINSWSSAVKEDIREVIKGKDHQ